MRKLRNIAIIAHVDHGKTTLVDKMILQGKQFRENEKQSGDLILDNNDQERERGITILAKNVSVHYKDYKINIIDTPGHSDFGGEVERVLNMADGVLLLVDAFEGTMPQTRFVLQKALGLGKKAIVVVNKVDKPNCRPDEVQEEVFDLMFSLGASEEQLDFKTIYGSAKQGWMSTDWKNKTEDITALLDAIIEDIPEPEATEGTPQMMITSLEYSSYIGRIAIGKLTRGKLKSGMPVTLCKRDGVTQIKSRIKDLMLFEGLEKQKVEEVEAGEICAIVGIEGFEIGDTIADFENPEALTPIAIDEPTMSMLFTINNSPFFGKDGKYVTSRHIKERLDRELEKNLALRGEPDAISGALALALGIGLQNIPEGAAVSLPLAQEGKSKCRAFAAGAASGLVEPLGGLLALALAGWVSAALPWLMSLAAGCMVCVTAQEMIPEAVEADEPAGVISVVAGFALMMALDVAL